MLAVRYRRVVTGGFLLARRYWWVRVARNSRLLLVLRAVAIAGLGWLGCCLLLLPGCYWWVRAARLAIVVAGGLALVG